MEPTAAGHAPATDTSATRTPATVSPPRDVVALVEEVEGWFSPEQIARLSARAAAVPAGGRVVEIGSFRGRSMIAIARSAGRGVEIVAIDPHAGNDRGPQEIEGFAAAAAQDSEVFLANLDRAGVRERVTYVRRFSHDALDVVPGPIDLLHIDGAHRFSPARDDVRRWGGKVAPGGTMLIHDAFSSVGVTAAIGAELTLARGWRYIGRSRSLAEYRREPLTGSARLANAGRQVAQLGWFARNLAIKLLVVARLGAVARLIGHDGETWPY
jgi:predicted O-methyltransferase YrrM